MTSEDVSDRDRWNERYRSGQESGVAPLLARELHRLPRAGRAIDVAGGTGQVAEILAARGLTTTVADVSDVALERAAERTERAGHTVETRLVDLAADGLPPGPWDVVTCFNYLDRALLGTVADELAPGGLLVITIATRTNLERHERPAARFLLDDGELPTLIGALDIELYREEWGLDGRHCAELIARRPPP
ncbi:MAG: class I SAM-dependent methyltransferase [Actinomycetota bacterium]